MHTFSTCVHPACSFCLPRVIKVGVEFDGKVGALRRVNQADTSTACGAAIGAYNALAKEALEQKEKMVNLDVAEDARAYGVPDGVSDAFDAQINFIKGKLRARLQGIDMAPDKVTFVTYQMFYLIREFLIDEVLSAPGIWDYGNEITVLGGIMVNRGRGGDRFMPLMFQSRRQEAGTTEDLFEKTFGPKVDLVPILGQANAEMAKEFFEFDLETYVDF